MKYIKLFEAFSKDYMKKIDLKDFKKIKKGAKLMYMGGKVEVLDNNGYVLKLKGEDDRIFMVNKSQFDHGGMTMRESVNELRSDMISGTSGRRIESLEDRKYELKKDVKGARIGDFVNVLLPKGTIIYNLPGGVFADHFSLKQKYSSRSSQGPRYFDKPTFKGISIRQMPDILAAIEKNSKVLESFDTEVNEGKIELALNKIEKWMPEDQDVQQEYYDIIDKGNVKGMEEFLDIHADEEVLKTFGIKYKDLGKLAKAAIKESVVNEGKNTIGLAFKEEQDYLDFKEFVAEQPRGAIRKNIGFDSKTKSWNVEMDVKVLDSIYGEGTPSDKKSGWYGGLPDDFESVIIESVVTEGKRLSFKDAGITDMMDLSKAIDALRDSKIDWNQKGQSFTFDSPEDLKTAREVLQLEESVVNEASDQQRLNHLRKFGIAPNNQPQNGAYIKSVSKPGKFFVDWKDAFGLGDVALEFVKSVGSISEFDIIDLNTMKRTGKQLDVKKGQLGNLRTTYGVRVNESSAKDGGDKSNGNSHHEDHKSNSIAQHWKDTYGEDFHSKYPAIAKIVKSRPGLDKRELKRIWDETYGENFEEQYPALWQKMD